MTETVFNTAAIRRAVLDLKAKNVDDERLVVIMPAAWRPLIAENPDWLVGVEVEFDDEVRAV